MSRKKQAKEKVNQQDEASKNPASTPLEALPAQTFDEYQCSGSVEIDFPALCALLDVKNIPAVCAKHSASSIGEPEGGATEDNQSQIKASPLWSKPRINVELEDEDPLSAKTIKISGWLVNEQIFRAIQKMLPSVSQLLSLQFWQAGLTDRMVISLTNTAPLCSNLRAVALEGNALPEQSFHLLLSEGSVLTHLSLRNNQIRDEGARLIGSALSTSTSANKNLLSLNLAFNSIGDAGGARIAQGLRLNRTLLFLSLSNNRIGDSGAAHLAAILGEFPLTHEEVVERRKLLLQRKQSSSLRTDSELSPSASSIVSKGESKGTSRKKEASRKEEKTPENREKSHKKASDFKTKGGKTRGREKQPTLEEKSSSSLNEAELVETGTPLLDQLVHHKDGQLFLPGNTTLASLNLAGNRITEKSLPLFLASLETQEEAGRSLLRLCLQRNLFPEECKCYVKIKEIMAAECLSRTSTEAMDGEGQRT